MANPTKPSTTHLRNLSIRSGLHPKSPCLWGPEMVSRAARRAIGLAISLSIALAAAPAARADEAYSFAVVPQFEQRKLFAIWRPIIDQMERRTGLKLKLVATLSVSDFEQRLAAGSFDFVFTNPYQILRESSRQGYIPLIRDAAPLRGILVVAKDGPIREIKELDGKVLAVPSPNAIGASMLLRADLERLHGVKMRLLNAKSHSSVYLHVANGLVDAGGGVEKTLREQEPAVQDGLRILYTTREMPSHPVSAHPRVPEADREKLRKALLELAATPEGRTLFSAIPMKQPVSTSMQDYRVMAEWNLERMWVDGPP